ncbi:MAG: rhodanese-like domain-containing protein [Bacillota bacterium]|jgi:thiosulfate/3-mercaptopyruvate sulfurtransferase|nr:rhodanese-like domain-containing protein [Bacillota bacterium]
MKKYDHFKIPMMLMLAMVLLVGCQEQTTATEEPAHTEVADMTEASYTGEYIVDAAYLKTKVADADTIIIDARGEDGAKSGRVQGAVAIAWGQLADVEGKNPGDEGWGHVLEADELAARLGELGIAKDKEVILYSVGNAGWGEDGRILWELQAAGYKNLKMVDGGWEAILATGVPTDRSTVVPEPVDVTIDKIDYKNIINTKELTEAYDRYKIVDTREKTEYDGAVLYGETKGGHLPGAINIPYTALYKADGTLKSNREIGQLFEEAGLEKEDEIVTYCTGGIRSAFMQLIMEMEGYDHVKNYEGSYYNWSAINEVE